MRFELERRGVLLVITAPSGGGKSAVLQRLRKIDPALGYSVSYTSRAPRGAEIDGKDYHFVARERFEAMIAEGAFYEHAEVHGNLYGTSAEVIERALANHEDIALDIDVQGGLNLKGRLPEAALVFLMPPSTETLEQRLRGRASDREDQIQLRLKNAKREMEFWDRYDYIVINEDLDETVRLVEDILQAERKRTSRTRLGQAP